MRVSDWIVSGALVLLVVRQVRGRRIGVVGLLWPVVLVGWAGHEYLGGVPGDRSDRTFVVALAAAGLALGVGCGLLTAVRLQAEVVTARASGPAAVLWVLGLGGRLAFGVAATSGGGAAVARLGDRLHLHAVGTWTTALIAMALAEVVARTVVLAVKYHLVLRSDRSGGQPEHDRGDGRGHRGHRAEAVGPDQ